MIPIVCLRTYREGGEKRKGGGLSGQEEGGLSRGEGTGRGLSRGREGVED